jgi:hypothetical protein
MKMSLSLGYWLAMEDVKGALGSVEIDDMQTSKTFRMRRKEETLENTHGCMREPA